MTKQNTAKPAQSGDDLRQRAARARDAAGRFIKCHSTAEISAPADQAEADLLQLGHQLDDAIARVEVLSREWMRVVDAAAAAIPERPACLYFRASDHALYLRMHLARPSELAGMEVTAEDVAWMRRKPYVREVRRPVRPEDGLPGDAHTVVESHPWPEAQARADEIITAWDAWKAECARVRTSIEGEEVEAEERAEAVEVEILALADRAAEMPATTAEGLRIKLRASAHYVEEHDADYPAGRLLNSLLRDAQGGVSESISAQHPDAALFALGDQFMAAWVAEEADGDEPEHRICTRIAQQIIRTPAVTVAGYGIKALLLARLDSDDTGPHRPIEASGPPDSWWNALRQVQHGAAVLAAASDMGIPMSPPAEAVTGIPVSGCWSADTVLVDMLDLASASMEDLKSIRDVAERVGSVAYAAGWNPRCHQKQSTPGALRYNDAGKLMNWLGDALTEVEAAVDKEVASRRPSTPLERETRLSILAALTIDDGDPEAIRAFALELLDHAAAESRGA